MRQKNPSGNKHFRILPRAPKAKRRPSKAANWASRLATVVTVLGIAAIGATMTINHKDQVGNAGTLGKFSEKMNLSCGGFYQPSQKVVFMANVPCGTVVKVAVGQRSTLAKVASQNMASNHVADLSLGTAKALGVDPTVVNRVSIRPLTGRLQGLLGMVPSVEAFQPRPAAPHRPSAQDILTLAQTMWVECNICRKRYGDFGMVAVAQVLSNRFGRHYRGKTTLHGIAYDGAESIKTAQFTGLVNAKFPPRDKSGWEHTRRLAEAILMGQISGNALSAQYWVSSCAVNYFAPGAMTPPGWAGNMQMVSMPNYVEKVLMHKFYCKKAPGDDPIGELIAEN